MRLTDMVELSGLGRRAPFYFTDAAEVYCPACCVFAADALPARQDILATGGFAAQKPGIYLPDVYASDFYLLEQQHNYISTLAYMRMTNDLVALDINNYELMFAAFVILHEYGHWLHFRRYRYGAEAYLKWLGRQLAPVEAQARLLALIPNDEPLKQDLVSQHIDAYNAMPQEFSANKYALKHLAAFYNKILKQQKK